MWFLSTNHVGVWRSWQRTCFGSLSALSGVGSTPVCVIPASDDLSIILWFATSGSPRVREISRAHLPLEFPAARTAAVDGGHDPDPRQRESASGTENGFRLCADSDPALCANPKPKDIGAVVRGGTSDYGCPAGCGTPRYGKSSRRSVCGPAPSLVIRPIVSSATRRSAVSSVSRRPLG